jgi:hypothetical protein
MDHSYWHKQSEGKPLYPDLIWSRPENRAQAGKLLIISGSAAGFSVAAQAYQVAEKAGAGIVRVVLPELLRKQVPKEVQFELDFAPSVAHGGFAKKALADLLEHAAWADAVLLPGGIGKNSETSALLEQFVQKYTGLLVIAEDALDVFIEMPKLIFERQNSVVVADFSQLQKMWHRIAPGLPAVTFNLPLQPMVELLHQATLQVASLLVTNHSTTLQVAYQGQVSTVPFEDKIWRVETASKTCVWAMQHPTKLFEAATTSVGHQQE